ncbi:MAG: ribosome biogenesis GTPase Der [Gemmatimonadota bacterium]|nr:MAG: ribosome biogenesis GTPase Der [Gemmatimonadota bacterium]
MERKPIVAIVGRPNVGKSTLFNRIIGKRLAVVDDVSGITRDRNYAVTTWNGRPFLLVDTVGWIPAAEERIERAIKNQVELAIDEADLVLFLVDAQTGILGLDTEIGSILRKTARHVLLVVNKIDDAPKEILIHQFLKLGLGDPVSISAMSGRNIGDLLDHLLSLLPHRDVSEELSDAIKVAVVGRPNVGKSSLVNAIVGQEKVIVDETPGTTRDAIDTHFEHGGQTYLFIDTAGLRRRTRITNNIEYYATLRTLRSLDRCDVAVILLDATEGITHQDITIAAQAKDAMKGVILLINKWDLVEDSAHIPDEYVDWVYQQLPFLNFAPVLFTSMATGLRVKKTLEVILRVAQERKRRIQTSQLNAFLEDVVTTSPPPTAKGRRANILYCTQQKVEPPSFIFFTNYPKLIGENYRRFLERKLRESFGFEGTPIRLIFRKRSKRK